MPDKLNFEQTWWRLVRLLRDSKKKQRTLSRAIIGQRGTLPVRPLGYLNFKTVIFKTIIYARVYLQYAWPSHHALEQRFAKATKAGAVRSCGCRERAALDNCYGFIDGTVRPIGRPQDNQRVVYNSHKRLHAIKFQSLTVQYGMIAQTYGPVGKCQSG